LFIRNCVAHDIAARLKYKESATAKEATTKAISNLPPDSGGVIVLDAKGNYTMPYNTDGMYRGYVTSDGKPHVEIYRK
jgi:beta-aspartyl-peptidase (threonine type)